MPEVRFATARDLFDSFTLARSSITVSPTEDPPLTFLRDLIAADRIDDALTFCAYLLPRREAVWWACRSVRALKGADLNANAQGLRLAEAWVREPDSEHRRAAEDFGKSANQDDPMTWLASAAAWSGGVITVGSAPAFAPPPELTPHAACVAILLSAGVLPPAERRAKLIGCVDDGVKLAETGLE
jgi:hypothetical protein